MDTDTTGSRLSLLIIRQIHVHPNFVAFLLEENISHCVVIFTLELQLKTLSLFSLLVSSFSLYYVILLIIPTPLFSHYLSFLIFSFSLPIALYYLSYLDMFVSAFETSPTYCWSKNTNEIFLLTHFQHMFRGLQTKIQTDTYTSLFSFLFSLFVSLSVK